MANLKGKQKKLDTNKDGKISGEDFKLLRSRQMFMLGGLASKLAKRLLNRFGDNEKIKDSLSTIEQKENQLNKQGYTTTADEQELNNLKYIEDFHTAYISLTNKELDTHNFQKGDTEGLVNYGLSIKGIYFATIFIEDIEQGIIKISFRSKGKFSVNQFSRKHFNGGGHDNAAGGKSLSSLGETTDRFLSLLEGYKTELNVSYEE